MWLPRLLRIRSNGSYFEGFTYLAKCWSHSKKLVITSAIFRTPINSFYRVTPSELRRRSFDKDKQTLKGCTFLMYIPVALKQHMLMTFLPLFHDIAAQPFDSFWEYCHYTSSIYVLHSSGKLYHSLIFSRFKKYSFTSSSLKAVISFILILSGFLGASFYIKI